MEDMAPRKEIPDGQASLAPLTPYRRSLEIQRAIRHVDHLLALHDRDGKLPAAYDPAALAQARDDLREIQATDVAAAALVGGVDGQAAYALFNRARRVLHALSPIVAMRLADKLDNENAPGSTRVIVKMAEGLGLLVPSMPTDAGGRKEMITEDELKGLSDEELDRRIREQK